MLQRLAIHVNVDGTHMNKRFRFKVQALQNGMVLLEGLIAILIFSVGILGVVGLQAAMIKGSADSQYRIEAGNIAQQRVAQMYVDQTKLADYEEVDTPIAATTGLPNGKRSTVRADASCDTDSLGAPSQNCVVVTVSWEQPGTKDIHNVTTVAHSVGG
jgi:type IV pilus assembly protein PilV